MTLLLFVVILFLIPIVCRPLPGLEQRRYNKEWTEYENGVPVRGVGYRGYWTNTRTVGDWQFKQREDGTWYDPKTGKDCIVQTLEEFLKEVK